jgi:hypothetical protein
MKMNFILFIIILTAGCRKPIDPVIPINPCLNGACDTSKLEIIWQRPIGKDTAELGSVRPLFWDNKVLFSQTFHNPDALNFFNSKTGEIIWSWVDYFPGSQSGLANPTGEGVLIQDNKIVFLSSNWSNIYCIDAQLGKTIWRTKMETGRGNPDFTVQDKYVYHVHDLRESGGTTKSFLVRSNISIGIWDTIYTQLKIDNFEPGIQPPSASWKNNKGEEIIFFQIRYWDFPGSKGRIDWLAYNITTKKEEYRFNNIDRGQIGNTLPTRQYGDMRWSKNYGQ